MKLHLILPLVAVASAAGAQNTPDAALRRLVDGWNRRDLKAAAHNVYGENPRADFSQFLRMAAQGGWPRVEIRDVKTQGGRGSAMMTYTVLVTDHGRTDRHQESIGARIAGGAWKVVPEKNPKANSVMPALAYLLTNPSMLAGTRQAAQATGALSNIKQLATACLLLASDENDRYAFTVANAKQKLKPYLRNDALWTAPGDPKGKTSFSINPAVAGKSLSTFAQPAQLVVLYQGSNGKLDFKYDGRAAVAFADGHAKLIRRADAAKLVWRP